MLEWLYNECVNRFGDIEYERAGGRRWRIQGDMGKRDRLCVLVVRAPACLVQYYDV